MYVPAHAPALHELRCVSDLTVCPTGGVLAHTGGSFAFSQLSPLFFVALEVNSCLMVIALQRQDIGKHRGGYLGFLRHQTRMHDAQMHKQRQTPGKAWLSYGSKSEM